MSDGILMRQRWLCVGMMLWATTSVAMNINDLMHPPEAHQQLVTGQSEKAEPFKPQPYEAVPDHPALSVPEHAAVPMPKMPPMIHATSAIVLPVFVNQAVTAALSFDYLNRGAMQQMAMRYFTQQGWFKFMTLGREKERRQVVAREAVVHAVVLDAPVVTSTHPGQWVVTMPVLQSFHRHGKMLARVTYDVTVMLTPGHVPGSWLVSGMALKPRRKSPASQE